MHRFFGAIGAAMLCFAPAPAQAELITSVSVEISQDGDLLKYIYELKNDDSSTFSVGGFSVDIDASADLQSITGPADWIFAYSPLDTYVAWESLDQSLDIQPGTTATFTFVSLLPPRPHDFLVVGYGLDDGSDISISTGKIGSPGVSAVPEPISAIPLGAGLITVVGLSARSRMRKKK